MQGVWAWIGVDLGCIFLLEQPFWIGGSEQSKLHLLPLGSELGISNMRGRRWWGLRNEFCRITRRGGRCCHAMFNVFSESRPRANRLSWSAISALRKELVVQLRTNCLTSSNAKDTGRIGIAFCRTALSLSYNATISAA